MKTTKISFIALIIGLAFMACQPQPPAMLEGVIEDENIKELTLSNIGTGLLEYIYAEEDNKYSTTMDIKEAQLLSLRYGRRTNYIYLKPHETITFKQDAEDSSKLVLVGDISAENKFLQEFEELKSQSNDLVSMREVSKLSTDSFLLNINKKYHGLDSLLAQLNQTKISSDFKSLAALRFNSLKANDLLNYPNWYKYHTKEEAKLGDNYYDFEKEIDLNSLGMLSFAESRNYGLSINQKGVDYKEFESTTAYFKELVKKLDKMISNPEVRQYYQYSYLKDQIEFGGGLDEVDEELTAFQNQNTNDYIKKSLEKIVEPWLALKSGNTAPDFQGVTRDGKLVNLSEFKGKNVYVDVWATWCGPCIAEIPALKKLEKGYHDKSLEFISISIDAQKDKEKWMKFVVDKELGGTQIMSDNAWQSKVVTGYNIKGIPRFILVNSEGNIVRANAPRPSDPGIHDLFEEVGI